MQYTVHTINAHAALPVHRRGDFNNFIGTGGGYCRPAIKYVRKVHGQTTEYFNKCLVIYKFVWPLNSIIYACIHVYSAGSVAKVV